MIKTWRERLGNSPHIQAQGAVGEAMQAEIDELRAALDMLEKQEPVGYAYQNQDGCRVYGEIEDQRTTNGAKLYLAAGAKDSMKMPTKTELNELYSAAHRLELVTKERDELHRQLYESKACQCGYDDVCEFAREAEWLKQQLNPMTQVADQYAHNLALELECVLADRPGYYDSAMRVLCQYRDAMSKIHEELCPTFMGDPLIVKGVLTGVVDAQIAAHLISESAKKALRNIVLKAPSR